MRTTIFNLCNVLSFIMEAHGEGRGFCLLLFPPLRTVRECPLCEPSESTGRMSAWRRKCAQSCCVSSCVSSCVWSALAAIIHPVKNLKCVLFMTKVTLCLSFPQNYSSKTFLYNPSKLDDNCPIFLFKMYQTVNISDHGLGSMFLINLQIFWSTMDFTNRTNQFLNKILSLSLCIYICFCFCFF